MKKQTNHKAGFAPFLIIGIVALLAIGGGAYAAKKNKDKIALENNIETQANANADANANANANLGINANINASKAKGTLRSLLALGEDSMCTFSSSNQGVSSTGTTYVSATGEMRGDFTSTYQGKATESHIIVKDETSFVWSGSQGAKMDISTIDASGSGNAQANQSNLDMQVDYDCSPWTKDATKFTLPTGVNFVDVGAMMKTSVQSGIKIPTN